MTIELMVPQNHFAGDAALSEIPDVVDLLFVSTENINLETTSLAQNNDLKVHNELPYVFCIRKSN